MLLHDVGKPPTFKSAEQTGDRIRFDGHAEMGARMAVEICRRLRFSFRGLAPGYLVHVACG